MENSNILVQFRTCYASNLDDQEIIPGSIIVCSDTGRVYHDTLDGERVPAAEAIEYYNTEAERLAELTPQAEVLYIVKENGKMYIFTSNWVCLNKDTIFFTIDNIEIPATGSSVVINDERIKSISSIEFVPIPALVEIFNGCTVSTSVANGSVTISTNCNYSMIGKLNVTSIA